MVDPMLINLYKEGKIPRGTLIGFNFKNTFPFVMAIVGGEPVEGKLESKPPFALSIEESFHGEEIIQVTLPLYARGTELWRPNTRERVINVLRNSCTVGDTRDSVLRSCKADRYYIGQTQILGGLAAIDEQDQGAAAIYRELIRDGELITFNNNLLTKFGTNVFGLPLPRFKRNSYHSSHFDCLAVRD